MRTKYVVYKCRMGLENVALFSPTINHCDMVSKGMRPTSAGFVETKVDDEGRISYTAYGKSLSLNLESKESDSELIKEMMEGY